MNKQSSLNVQGAGGGLVILTQAVSRVVSFCRAYRKKSAFFRTTACAALVVMLSAPQFASATIVRVVTSLGAFNVELYDAQAPGTVENFLNYVISSRYNNSIIHRHATVATSGVSVIQGGGIACCDLRGNIARILADSAIQNEFDPARSNIRGTIAMAKTADPDSATSEWFINLDDNSAALDDINNSGGFTVFGHVLDPGMDVVDRIAMLDVIDFSDDYPAFPFGELPVIDYDPALGLLFSNFVFVNRVCLNDDADGVCSGTEDLAPDGDGNGDRIPDRDQANVATIIRLLGNTATFSANAGMKFDFAAIINGGTVLSWLTTFTPPPDQSAHFNNGVFTFTMTGAMGASGVNVTLHDGSIERPTHYYAHGPTLDNPAPHWYDFTFDGVTGAEIGPDRITLHFVDGMRGDDDLTANNSITHTGGQAVVTPVASPQSGGCSIAMTSSKTPRGGEWTLIAVFLIFLAIRRRIRHSRLQ